MRALLYALMITGLFVCVAAEGGKDKAGHDEWMKHAMEKETRRAKEAAAHHGNIERFEKKYSWLREENPKEYGTVISANKAAAAAWSAVSKKCATAKSPEELSEVKTKAHAAAGEAYLAEIALKYAGSAHWRKDMVGKTGDPKVKALAAKLDANERAQLKAHQSKHEASMHLRKLELENREMNSDLKSAYEAARSKGHGHHHKKK